MAAFFLRVGRQIGDDFLTCHLRDKITRITWSIVKELEQFVTLAPAVKPSVCVLGYSQPTVQGVTRASRVIGGEGSVVGETERQINSFVAGGGGGIVYASSFKIRPRDPGHICFMLSFFVPEHHSYKTSGPS